VKTRSELASRQVGAERYIGTTASDYLLVTNVVLIVQTEEMSQVLTEQPLGAERCSGPDYVSDRTATSVVTAVGQISWFLQLTFVSISLTGSPPISSKAIFCLPASEDILVQAHGPHSLHTEIGTGSVPGVLT
jgi:hypothetical protein